MTDLVAGALAGKHHSPWLASALFVGCIATTVACAAPAASRTHSVTIEGMRYAPPHLVVHRGDRVIWANKDSFPHTVTARSGTFDSHGIAPNGSWYYVADKVGKYPYVCTFHPTMQGTLIVE